MAASRLSDSQKQELVARYRQGETGQALAQAYGCSPNTVSRVLKAALGAEELASLKKQSRAGVRSQLPAAGGADEAPAIPADAITPEPSPVQSSEPEPELGDDPEADAADSTLAIDDADDFSDDGLDDGDEDADEPDQPLPLAVNPSQQELQPRPLAPDSLPGSLYLLVDKTVELDARPLREFSELGSLPEDEQERQALMLYVNPRQAKRQCGRSQRVIKVPDSGVLQRTSRYLVAQGITRLVLEGGGVFAIPGG